ncbi:TPA: metal-dependent hydrolase [Candidatus Dependentiae bacterium]|nr:MAG: hypothetical protein A2Y17_09650 [Clostridiales bacterium GWF2_38_85]HBL98940.1 metal-dependent hydrolase [Candidatus Dependentiae bacterium]
MFTETHCHLEMIVEREGKAVLENSLLSWVGDIVKSAQKSGVEKIITVGTTVSSSQQSVQFARAFPPVFASVGIHPCDGTASWKEDFVSIKSLIAETPASCVVALGETGLDFYHPGFNKERQKDLFRAHIDCALEEDLPLIIHTRSSVDETLAILKEYAATLPRGVFHCFLEDLAVAQEVVALGFFLGIAGPVTYPKNEMLRTVVLTLGLDHLLLETDSPFLPPQAIRGKINYPAQVATIGQYLATLLGVSSEAVASRTTENATRLFKFQKQTL